MELHVAQAALAVSLPRSELWLLNPSMHMLSSH